MHVGALEARRWAGLVLAAGPDDGVGLRLAFLTPDGERRELDDWYWMVSRVGPHAPNGSYARIEFDLGVDPAARGAEGEGAAADGGVAASEGGAPANAAAADGAAAPGVVPSPAAMPRAGTLVLEWSRRGDAVALRAIVRAPGRLEVIGDAPWGWAGRWVEGEGVGGGRGSGAREAAGGERRGTAGEAVWRAGLEGAEIVAAFEAGTRPCTAPDPSRGEVARFLEVEEGAAGRVAMVAVWGDEASSARAARLAGRIDEWIEEAKAGWRGDRPRCETHPDLLESIADNLMWTILLQPETGRLYAPAGRRWIFPRPRSDPPVPDDWTVFGWDSFFNALLLATASGDLAWAALLAGVASRYPNGNVPNWRSRRGGTPDRSQPPVGSLAALKLHLLHPDRDALAATYPGLLAWCDWWMADRGGRPRREGLTPGLLSWGSDTHLLPGPGSVPPWEEGATGHQRAAWESGQDDLPLWEEAEWDPERRVLAMSAVDLCSYRALDLECLSRIARLLGDDSTAQRLATERRRLVATMNRVLWSEPDGLYLDELPSGHSTRVAASNFLPLVAGVPPPSRARRMIRTLRDPARFWGRWIIPTIPRDDPAFTDQQYWRGSIWPPMNYLVLQGLRRYGFRNLAAELARRGANMFLADRQRTGMCRENFDSRTGRGHGHRFQSWAPLFALGALEEARGDDNPWRTGSRPIAGARNS